MDWTQNRMTHTGEKVEPTDKVYFRKMDEVSFYTEAKLKCMILMTKKWSVTIQIHYFLYYFN